jgi:hypothetical protein
LDFWFENKPSGNPVPVVLFSEDKFYAKFCGYIKLQTVQVKPQPTDIHHGTMLSNIQYGFFEVCLEKSGTV